MRRRAVVTAVAVVIAAGVAIAAEKITFLPKDKTKYPAKPEKCEVEVFQDDAKPSKKFEDIGVLNYHDERHRSNDSALKLDVAIPKMKPHVCKAGGDALMAFRVTESRRLEWAVFNVRATVIRFLPD